MEEAIEVVVVTLKEGLMTVERVVVVELLN